MSCREIAATQVPHPTAIEITSTLIPMAAPTASSSPIPSQEATTDFGTLCNNSVNTLDSEISPNGKWMAAECYSENNGEDSPLQIVNRDRSKDWKIYFRDFAKGDMEYGRKNIMVPYRWSKDENFLYVTSPSISSGCCWMGGEYLLLIRLNLETGEQTNLLNGSDLGSFTISENERFLLFTPVTNPPYDIRVLDLLSLKVKVVNLQFQKDTDLKFAVMSPDENLIVLPLFQQVEFNTYRVDSIVLIDLTKNTQRLLVSDLKKGNELYPIRWMDKEKVLLSSLNPNDPNSQSQAEYWLLNTTSGQLEKTEEP